MAKKKKYRLQIVLERKKKARDEAALYLAEKREILQREEQEEVRLQNELAQNRSRRVLELEAMTQQGFASGLEAAAVQQRMNYVKRLDRLAEELKETIVLQKKKIEQAQVGVQEALANLLAASRELKLMEKHKEKWQRKIRRQEDLAEQQEMNEIGNVMYNAVRSRVLTQTN